MKSTRRAFVATGLGSAVVAATCTAQYAVGGTSTVTRLDLAKIDRERILTTATTALGRTPKVSRDLASDEFLNFTLDVPALAAAAQIDPENAAKYGDKAGALLKAWFGKGLKLEISGWEDLLQLSGMAEVAVSLAFLALDADLLGTVKAWFRQYLTYLTTDMTAGLARDAKDRNGSSWLLQVSAFGRLCEDDKVLTEARTRFRHATLRAEINADGLFTHELTTTNPFANSLFNLDLLAGVCVLLSTRFESIWNAELQDGPGMRAAVARHAPYMAKPATWPYEADETHFKDLPGRRPVLAFAARAYAQPDYAAEFLTLKDVADPAVVRTMPIRQPLLWVSQPRRRTPE